MTSMPPKSKILVWYIQQITLITIQNMQLVSQLHRYKYHLTILTCFVNILASMAQNLMPQLVLRFLLFTQMKQ